MKKLIILLLVSCIVSSVCDAKKYPSQRPAENERLFVSAAVEAKIQEVVKLLENDRLAWMFANCYPNTLDTTIHPVGEYDTFANGVHAMLDAGHRPGTFIVHHCLTPEEEKRTYFFHTPRMNFVGAKR